MQHSNYTRIVIGISALIILSLSDGLASPGYPGSDAWLIKTDPNGNEQWNKTFGEEYDDYAASVQKTADGGYILAGYSTMDRPGNEVWLIKTDIKGNQQWKKDLGENDYWLSSSLVQTSDGGYILTGMSESLMTGAVDALLIKTDSNGNKQWSTTFGGDKYDRTLSVFQAKDSGLILSGYTESYGAGGSDAWIIKTDAEGNEQWNKTFGGTGSDASTFIRQTSNGNYFMIGQSTDMQGNGSDIWLFKLDSDGKELWGNKTIEKSQYYSVRSVQNTEDGGLILAGATSRTASSQDVFLIKMNSTGSMEWKKILKGNGYNGIYSVIQTLDGGYAFTGLTSGANYDGWLVKTDANGDEQWRKMFGGPGGDDIRSVLQTSDGGFILAGSTNGFGELKPFDSYSSAGFDIIIAIIGLLAVILWKEIE